jgi:hypothetical protein
MAVVIKQSGGERGAHGDELMAFIPGGSCHQYEYHVGMMIRLWGWLVEVLIPSWDRFFSNPKCQDWLWYQPNLLICGSLKAPYVGVYCGLDVELYSLSLSSWHVLGHLYLYI